MEFISNAFKNEATPPPPPPSNGWASWLPSSVTNNNNTSAEDEEMFSLSFTKRVTLFVVFMGIGLFFCFISTWMIITPKNFAKFYTLGVMSILLSTFFLVGPKKQLKSMFHPSRALAAIIYLGSMFVTLYSALKLQSTGLTLLMIIVQFGAAIWYGASYIPMGQSCLRSTAKTILPI